MADFAFEKYFLAQGSVLSARAARRTRKHEGSENVNPKICHWPIRRSLYLLECRTFDAPQHKHARFGSRVLPAQIILSGSAIWVKLGSPKLAARSAVG